MNDITKEDGKKMSREQTRKRAREALASSKNFIYLAAGIYLISILYGFAYSDRFRLLLDNFKQSVGYFHGKSALVLILLIFIRNFLVTIASAFLGVVLGFVPVLSAVLNGILFGTVVSITASSHQLVKLWLLIPHGIFELPAMIIAWGIGMWHGAWLFRKDRDETLKERRHKVSLVFFRYSVPLLIVAAVIEGLMAKLLMNL